MGEFLAVLAVLGFGFFLYKKFKKDDKPADGSMPMPKPPPKGPFPPEDKR